MKMIFLSDEDYKEDFYKLTHGKVYDVEFNSPNEPIYSSIGIYYDVINDVGDKKTLYESNFMYIKEWRELQINDILNENN